MANEEHLNMLFEEGCDAWNAWRQENPDIQPDLSKERFRGRDLRDLNLSGTNLSGVSFSDDELRDLDLANTNLTEADLSSTYLFGSDLSGANLTKANLAQAYLGPLGAGEDTDELECEAAILCNANLREAFLVQADLREVDLSGADLSGACLEQANLTNANFKVDPFVKTGGRAVVRATLLLFLLRCCLFYTSLIGFPSEYTSAGVQ